MRAFALALVTALLLVAPARAETTFADTRTGLGLFAVGVGAFGLVPLEFSLDGSWGETDTVLVAVLGALVVGGTLLQPGWARPIGATFVMLGASTGLAALGRLAWSWLWSSDLLLNGTTLGLGVATLVLVGAGVAAIQAGSPAPVVSAPRWDSHAVAGAPAREPSRTLARVGFAF